MNDRERQNSVRRETEDSVERKIKGAKIKEREESSRTKNEVLLISKAGLRNKKTREEENNDSSRQNRYN